MTKNNKKNVPVPKQTNAKPKNKAKSVPNSETGLYINLKCINNRT